MSKAITKSAPPNLVGQPSVKFDLDTFEAALWNKGYDIILEKAVRCPCQDRDAAAKLTCHNCLGTGWVFLNALQTKAIITGINKTTAYKNWSQELLGTVAVTTRAVEKLGFMDRITLINDTNTYNTSIYSEILRVRDVAGTPFVFLSYKPYELEKMKVYAFQGDELPLIKLPVSGYSISSNNPYVLEFSYDFSTIGSFNGIISVTYEHEIQYHILDLPHDVRNSTTVNACGQERQIEYPINAIARKAHNVFEKADRDGTGLINNSDPNFEGPEIDDNCKT
jgi:DNA helicase HerA-like ATPase